MHDIISQAFYNKPLSSSEYTIFKIEKEYLVAIQEYVTNGIWNHYKKMCLYLFAATENITVKLTFLGIGIKFEFIKFWNSISILNKMFHNS